MKSNFLRRHPMYLPFRDRYPLKNGRGLFFHPVRKLAVRNQLPDLLERAAMRVAFLMRVSMAMRMRMMMGVTMAMRVTVLMLMVVPMVMPVSMAMVVVVVLQMNVEFGPGAAPLLGAGGGRGKAKSPKFFVFSLEVFKSQPRAQHPADKHVAADAAEQVQVKGL